MVTCSGCNFKEDLMKLVIQKLVINDFKSHRNIEIKPYDLTEILGDNGQGKSTIGDSLPWLFYGTDMMGTKMNPEPTTYIAKETFVEALILIDEKPILLRRTLSGGKTKYHLNEVPIKAKEYEAHIEKIVPKELFLSTFNPMYFTSQHWETQRKMLIQYVAEPTNTEILNELNPINQQNLREQLKKRELDDIETIAREQLKRTEDQATALRSRIKTLQEQGESDKQLLANNSVPVEKIDERISELEQTIATAPENSTKDKREAIQREINLKKQIGSQKRVRFEQLQKTPVERPSTSIPKPPVAPQLLPYPPEVAAPVPIPEPNVVEDSCPTCKQSLPAERIEATRNAQLEQWRLSVDSQRVAYGKQVKAREEQLKQIDIMNQRNQEQHQENVKSYKESITQLQNELEQAYSQAVQKREDDIQILRTELSELVHEIKKLQADLELISMNEETFDPQPLLVEIRALQEIQSAEVRDRERTVKIEQAEADLKEATKSIGEAHSIIQSVKNFRAKRAELMIGKINDLFKTLSVRLFDYVAARDDYKPAFELERNGVPFRLLSLSEKIKTGLEVAEVLMELSGTKYPVFVDNAESIVEIPKLSTQMFMAKVKANSEIIVQSKEMDAE